MNLRCFVGFELRNSPLKNIGTFIAAVLVVSCPFWLAGYFLGGVILPGLPVSALMAVVPALAAMILTAGTGGWVRMWELAARIGDCQRASPASLLLAALVMPMLTLCAWAWMRRDGVAMPDQMLSPLALAGLFIVFWFAAIGEELGWSGYLVKPAIQCVGFMGAGLAIGITTALWHLVPLLQASRDLGWIGWWALGTIAARLIALAIYRWSNESVFAVSTLHAAQNVAWQAFPINGSHYDPSYTAPVFLVAGVTCTVIALYKR